MRRTFHLFDITMKDFSLIKFGNRHIFLPVLGPTLDFGGFAKGYALKKIKELIEQKTSTMHLSISVIAPFWAWDIILMETVGK